MRAFAVLSALAAAVAATIVVPREPSPEDLQKRAPAPIIRSCKVANTVAITFDDGPYSYQQELLTTLAKYNAKATFFLNGRNWACIYDDARIASIKALYAAGHEFGGHTWSHSHLNTLTWDKIHHELWLVEQALIRILGVNPALFRPPYGEYNDLVLSAVNARNQSVILWDYDSGDSVGKTVQQMKDGYTALANKKPSNVLTLNHEVYNTTVKTVIPHALQVLSAKGYKFVTVSQCLGIKPYQSIVAPSTKDSTWKC
ncbi:carbohydrate esterase family 4 protein [Auricularia subglabra TFB-10046 SS5]|nr:carbohydrate esterase family 4 protein [Auricularia subglabra TFB-10046 SS5]